MIKEVISQDVMNGNKENWERAWKTTILAHAAEPLTGHLRQHWGEYFDKMWNITFFHSSTRRDCVGVIPDWNVCFATAFLDALLHFRVRSCLSFPATSWTVIRMDIFHHHTHDRFISSQHAIKGFEFINFLQKKWCFFQHESQNNQIVQRQMKANCFIERHVNL